MKTSIVLCFAIVMGLVLYGLASVSEQNRCTSVRAFGCPEAAE